MNDSVKKLATRLGNGFSNLEDCEKKLKEQDLRLNEYEKLLNFINCDAKKLNKYEDQSIILDAIDNINSSKKEYEAACYLLDGDDDKIALLPQYRNARVYLESVISYLKTSKDRISDDVKKLKEDFENMTIIKKYFEILSDDKPFVEDIDEFINLLDKEQVVVNEKNDILSYIIISNVSNYKKN